MTATVDWDEVDVGDALPAQEFRVQRFDLVRYAGASGDFNVIHWNERVARSVGLPDVIAHGMLTMAVVGRLASDWAGDPAAVVEYGTRFTRPVPVPDDDEGALLEVGPSHGQHEPPFYVAGSDHWASGYMEGAVATGRRAAAAVVGDATAHPTYPASRFGQG